MIGGFTECPFDECDWTTADEPYEVEVDAIEGGWDRLALHLRIVHGAHQEPDGEAWEDGSWRVLLFPRKWDWAEGDWR